MFRNVHKQPAFRKLHESRIRIRKAKRDSKLRTVIKIFVSFLLEIELFGTISYGLELFQRIDANAK